jgi:two-component system nitrogen regulation sensor histidine kinase NtrY
VRAVCGRGFAALQKTSGHVAGAAREAAQRMRQRVAETQSPLDPLLEANGPPLPGTGTRAFWVGLIVVSLSVVWALATFLILTNLTPIAPREEVVYIVLFVNLLLVIAMVAVIAVHVVGLWRAWE